MNALKKGSLVKLSPQVGIDAGVLQVTGRTSDDRIAATVIDGGRKGQGFTLREECFVPYRPLDTEAIPRPR